LASMRPDPTTDAEQQLAICHGEPRFVPGAMGSWWEIVLALGVVSIPARVAATLISNRMWQAYLKSKSDQQQSRQTTKARLIFRNDSCSFEFQIESWDHEAIRSCVEAALIHVNRKS